MYVLPYRFSFVLFVFEGSFQVYAPVGLYWEGRFNGVILALRVRGAGLYLARGISNRLNRTLNLDMNI